MLQIAGKLQPSRVAGQLSRRGRVAMQGSQRQAMNASNQPLEQEVYRAASMPGCKDANDVLLRAGTEGIKACVQAAIPYPVKEIVRLAILNHSASQTMPCCFSYMPSLKPRL